MRARSLVLLLLLLMAGLCSLSGCQGDERTAGRHVFVYLIDTLRPDHLSTYGYERATSPHLDALARDGIVFTRATTSNPWTRPACASLFTGLPASVCGVRGRAGFIPDTLRTWPEALAELGYQTCVVSANPHVIPEYGFGQGVADFKTLADEIGATKPKSSAVHQAWLQLPKPADRPLFHYLHAVDPHTPLLPRPDYRDVFAGANPDPGWDGVLMPEDPSSDLQSHIIDLYDCEILENDVSLGALIGELRRLHMYDDSWIVVVSDHGEQLWEHGLHGHGNGLWETLLHIPLVIKPPGGRGGDVGRDLAQRADQPLGLHALPDLIGPYLSPDWRPLGGDNAARLGFSAETAYRWVPEPGGRMPPLRLASFQKDHRSQAMVEIDGLKLVWHDLPDRFYECFDLNGDPGESQDLLGAGSTLEEALQGRIEALRNALALWHEEVTRGLEFRFTGEEPGPEVVFYGNQNIREATIAPGDRPRQFDFRYEERRVIWAPSPGDRLFLRFDAGVEVAASLKDGNPVLIWPSEREVTQLLPDLAMRPRSVGLFLAGVEPAATPSPQTQRALRALGYVD
jgi:hypothetical protein